MITDEQREKLRGWFTGRLPDDLFEALVEVVVDREEITVIGRIPGPRLTEDVSAAEREAAVQGRIQEFRERTREERVEVAREAEHKFRRKVSWGVECEGERALFTHVAAPVMTRLRQPERQVLDTLIAAWRRPQPQRRPRLVRPAGPAAHRRLARRTAGLPGTRPAGAGAGSGHRGGGRFLCRGP